MPGRSFSATNEYRYGFNGKENDKDISAGAQDYGMRIYDSRLGKFLSVDPLTKEYAELTPYQFATNSPISGIDLDGKEYYYAADGKLLGKYGKSTEVRIVNKTEVASAQKALSIYKKNPESYNKSKAGGYLQFYLPSMGSQETFTSPAQAAESFVLMYGSISIVDDIEYVAKIGGVSLEGKNQKVFVLGTTATGSQGSGIADPNESKLEGTTLEGFTHTHGQAPRDHSDNVNFFSGSKAPYSLGLSGDMDLANNHNVPIFLGNPRGELRVYNPHTYSGEGVSEGILLKSNMPYDIHASSGDHITDRPAYDYKKIVYEQRRDPVSSEAIPYKLIKK